MLLAVDIGNSLIKFGVFDEDSLVSKFSIPTNRDYAPDDIANAVGNKIDRQVTDAVACSVVPQIDDAISEFIKRSFNVDTRFIDNTFNFGLKVNYQPLNSLGADRLVNASAAVAKYGKPCIVCSLGTATTIDAVSDRGEFLGGVIAPGMQIMARAIHLATAKLPEVEIFKPASILGNSTIESIRSGGFYGYVGLVEGLIERIAAALPYTAKTVATGGFAAIVAAESSAIDIVDENLTLKGLRLLHTPDRQLPSPTAT
jgi:type III pantothenate kinase